MKASHVNAKITRAFKSYIPLPASRAFSPIPRSLTAGKLYEAYVIALVARELVTQEGLKLILSAGKHIRLRSSPGPIDRNYPRIDVYKGKKQVAEIWTDIEFLTLSHGERGRPMPLTRGDCHELDIIMVPPGLTSYPGNEMILLAVECKNTGYKKSLLKEILGVRRELSLLVENTPTCFTSWPRTYVPARPASCLLVYSTDSNVREYTMPGNVFGIDFCFEPLWRSMTAPEGHNAHP